MFRYEKSCLTADVLPGELLLDLRLRVVRGRGLPQAQHAAVLLAHGHEAVDALGGAPRAHDQQPCCHGVQRPRMPHLPPNAPRMLIYFCTAHHSPHCL